MNPRPHRCSTSRIAFIMMLMAVLGAMSGCATGPERNPADPLEPLNRATFRFNDAVDRTIAAPVARGYNRVVPQPVRSGVDNFFSNLGDVVVMFNDLAQGRFADGMSDLMRVTINTTFGIVGVFDIATQAGLEKHDQDFGLTLGHWGFPTGPYLVLPLFGPSTLRDTAGFAVDQYAQPMNYQRPAVRNSLWGLDFVSTRARYLGATDLLEAAALDKYLFTRDAYLGRRQYQLTGGQEQGLPDYEREAAPGAVKGQ
ncbi:MAG: transporter [Massilia sp.]|nr:transporter [Massilia sp.]